MAYTIPSRGEDAIRVFCVDDTAYMRMLIADIADTAGGMRSAGAEGDPAKALRAIQEADPDIVTLDIEMPGMDGITLLRDIMTRAPRPVIMVSSLTRSGADTTLQALSAGAADYICKARDPAGMKVFKEELVRKIRSIAESGRRSPAAPATRPFAAPSAAPAPVFATPSAPTRFTPAPAAPAQTDLFLIAASTGGVEALGALLPSLGADIPPTVVVQHMPKLFTESLAARLNGICPARVTESKHNMRLEAGTIYIAAGGMQCRLRASGAGYVIDASDTARVSGHSPSADALFYSAASCAKGRVCAAILTGMGADGAEGLKALRDKGAATIGQDEATCLIYGMPRAAFDAGAVERQLPLPAIASAMRSAMADGARAATV